MTFNFVSASKLEINEQVTKKTKKRGKVSEEPDTTSVGVSMIININLLISD